MDTKDLSVFVKKIIDVLESYNLDKTENKIIIRDMPPNMNVYRLPELFSLFAMVFGKLKDERDVMNERRMREKALANGATNE